MSGSVSSFDVTRDLHFADHVVVLRVDLEPVRVDPGAYTGFGGSHRRGGGGGALTGGASREQPARTSAQRPLPGSARERFHPRDYYIMRSLYSSSG